MPSVYTKMLSLNISRKILVGYLVLAAFTIALGIFSLSALNRINRINHSIIERDTQIIRVTDQAMNLLLSQENYGRRYVILKTPQMRNLFWEQSVEFKQRINELKKLPDINTELVDEIVTMHNSYTENFSGLFEKLMQSKSSRTREKDKSIKQKQQKIMDMLNSILSKAHINLDRKTHLASSIGMNAFRIAVILCSLALLTGISSAAMTTRGISDSIEILKTATIKIAAGEFDDIPLVNKNDELGELSRAFWDMAVRIKHLEEMYLDASPLTHLPGGVAIETLLKKRLASGKQMAFCLLDMDNFKALNDYYGYAKGSELIVALANIIESTVNEFGEEDDFVGHIGGDDFALITEPRLIPVICKNIIKRFDHEALEFYAPEDRERGYIIGETRQGEEARFPLVSISIAVVTNQNRTILNHLVVGEIAAELKEYAKSIQGSVYVIDHRRKEINRG